MLVSKLSVSIIIIIIVSLILRYINGYTTFNEGFVYSLLVWTTINIYDVIVLDILWLCQSKKYFQRN